MASAYVIDTDGTTSTVVYESADTITGLCAGDCTDPDIPPSSYTTTATKGTKTKSSFDLTNTFKTVVDYIPLENMDYIKVSVTGFTIAYAKCNSTSQDRPTATASAALKGTIVCKSP